MPPDHEPEHTIEIYVHSDSGYGPDLVEVPSDGRVADLVSEDESLWLEDTHEALPADSSLPEAGIARRSHVHRGRCRTVKVRVRHAGTEIVGEFSPATRVVQVFRWATGPRGFKLPEAQIPKHGLALPGGDELLDPGTHVGSLVSEIRCAVTIDLVPKDRFAGMITALTVSPDELAVRAALDSGAFQSGVDDGRWRLVELEWPMGVFAVSAAPRANSPAEFGLRIDLSGYPQQAPTAEPWSIDRRERLTASERPKGERAAHVFRSDWEHGRALYAPWDRVGLSAHSEWAGQHRNYAWHPGRDLAFFLRCVYDLLNDDDYLGI